MLNLKKGLAVVLAAATALTFAPVANLGAPVQAEAAETTKLADKSGTIRLTSVAPTNTAVVTISDLAGLNLSADDEAAGVTAHVGDKTIAKIESAGSNKTKGNGGGTSVDTGAADETVTNLIKDDTLKITALKAGTTTVTLSFGRAAHRAADYTQTLTVVVGDLSPVSEADFDKIEAKLTKNDGAHSYYTTKKDASTAAAEASSQDYADVKVNVKNYNLTTGQAYTLDVTSTNSDVAAINNISTYKTGTTATATAGRWDTTEVDAATVNTTNADVTIRLKALGSATVNIRLYASATAGEKTKLVTEIAIPVSVTNGIDTLTVSYDANRDGVDETAATLSTGSDDIISSPNKSDYYEENASGDLVTATTDLPTNTSDASHTYYNSDRSKTYVSYFDTVAKFATTLKRATASPAIYLDTDKNTSIKINAVDKLSRNVIFGSSNNYISVDQKGNVTVNEKKLPTDWTANNYRDFVTISVPQSGTGAATVSGFTVTVPVYISNQATTTITVKKSNGETIAKTIGGTNFNSDVTKLGTIYLSTADKTSDTVTVESSTGDAYLSGQAYTGVTSTDVNNIASDAVAYTAGAGLGTVSLTKNAKNGDVAIVKLVANNSSSQVNSAKVYFRVVVTSKKANIKVTADSPITLTAANKTANVKASVNSTSELKYAFVSAVGDNTSAGTASYGDVKIDQSGNVTYAGSSTGTAVIRITGYETTDALAPDAAYVTVNYSSTKAASDLSVSTKELNLKPDETAKIVASGSSISYKSSNEDVATVAADGTVTAKKAGVAVITVSSPETSDKLAGTEYVTVTVSQTGDIDNVTKPTKVTGVKVTNLKGGKVRVTWTKQNQKNIKYYVKKTVGKKSAGKSVNGGKTTLTVKKGATVKVKVKAYIYDAAGKKLVGSYSTTVSKKTDKK